MRLNWWSIYLLTPILALYTRINTSGYGQRGKFIFCNCKASTVVGGNANIIPSGRLQVKDNEVSAWFYVVRDLIPLDMIPVSEHTIKHNWPVRARVVWRMTGNALFLVFDDKVWHAAATVLPGWQMKCNRIGWRLDELGIFGHYWLGSLGACVQNVRGLSSADAVTWCKCMVLLAKCGWLSRWHDLVKWTLWFTHCSRWHRLDSAIHRRGFRSCIFVRRQQLQLFPNRQILAYNAVCSRGLEPSPFRGASIWLLASRWWWRWV